MTRILQQIALLLAVVTLGGCSTSHKTLRVDSQSVRPITCLDVMLGSARFNQPLPDQQMNLMAAAFASSALTEYLQHNGIRHCRLPAAGGDIPSHVLVANPIRAQVHHSSRGLDIYEFNLKLIDGVSRKVVWEGEAMAIPPRLNKNAAGTSDRCEDLDRVHSPLKHWLTALNEQGFLSTPGPLPGASKREFRGVKCP